MGLLGALFGGGTKLDLHVDVESIAQGGQLSGHVTVHGGKKPLTLTSVSVRLNKVKVQMKEGSSLPDVKLSLVVQSELAKGDPLPPGSEKRFAFRFKVPADVETSSLGTSYTVSGHADIPGVADPSASAKLKIVEGQISDDLTVEDIIARYPGLESSDDDELEEALRELHNACYSQRETLLAAEALLVPRFHGSASPEVKRGAFRAWANLVDNQVRPDHLRLLTDFAAQQHDSRMTREILTAVAKFAEEGTLPMLQRLSQHPDASLRADLAKELWHNARDDFPGKREVLGQLVGDADGEVRAAAVGALSGGYRDDAALLRWIAGLFAQDPDPEVQAACVGALSLAHHNGLGDVSLGVFEAALQSPHESVRSKVADSLSFQPEEAGPRVVRIVERLLADPSEEVRRDMAFQVANLEEFPEVVALGQRAAESDPSLRVRARAITALAHAMPVQPLIAFYERLLANNPSEDIWNAAIRGADRQIKEPVARAFLEKLAAQDSEMGAYARGRLAQN